MFRACVAALGLIGWLTACRNDERPPLPPDERSNAGAAPGILVPPASGRPLTCGGEELIALTEPPVLYFVIDRSGSMADSLPGQSTSKYEAARRAVGELLDSIGHRVRYGAAVYPSDASQCDSGRQIFAPTLGDAPSGVPQGQRGSVLVSLLNRLAGEYPAGSTPTGAVLRRTRLVLQGQGAAYVVLITDGAPNCGSSACSSDRCIPDIERVALDEQVCGVDFSCCDSGIVGPGAAANCIDEQGSEAAAAALAEATVPTYVIGMPGSEAYSMLLDRLAIAGGTARSATRAYYPVSDAAALARALHGIGAQVALSCRIELGSRPQDPKLVNVYFDGEIVAQNAENGWAWSSNLKSQNSGSSGLGSSNAGSSGVWGDASGGTGPSAGVDSPVPADLESTAGATQDLSEETRESVGHILELHGPACAALEAGEVRKIEITYGCQTIVR